MLDGHGFDLNVGLPVKKSDVVTINTEVFSFTREQGMPSVDHPLEFNVPRYKMASFNIFLPNRLSYLFINFFTLF